VPIIAQRLLHSITTERTAGRVASCSTIKGLIALGMIASMTLVVALRASRMGPFAVSPAVGAAQVDCE
jgi:uncharacterized membrane protein